MEIPMLNEKEYEIAEKLYRKGFKVPERDREKRFKELLDFYNELTGFEETEPNAIMHHRISIYGTDCEKRGKPYRTPKASFCAFCGNKKE